ncbi:iron(III) transport system substrate-binding protein [Bradyrhizobium sp. NFR13]|uniref:extracellular solute-binding protein n=1 Tax=Bradyrhizobium sp. NFR13 TaxID=1566285 RepID=UPI0008F20E41|nr:extracellular solute-binding protein [Bradyrhizobium sp. NFR13]SFL90361.1 iron(III) transport system substrate-binding protein [Bradyrhizobium sp. NFR13]
MATPRRTTAFLIALVSTWLSFGMTTGRAEEINLYSTREPQLVEPVIASFTAATGITVRLTYIEDNLVKRMKAEGDASPADVLMTIGLDKTSQFAANDLSQPTSSSLLDRAIPPQLRGREWISLSVRPRVVVVRNDSPQGAIRYEDLADPRFRGQLCIRSPLHQNNVALIAAYLVYHGADATEAWLRGIKANLAHAPEGKDNDVIRQLAEGRCSIGIANTVALAQLRDGREGADWTAWANKVKTVPTTFDGAGTHVNLTGAALAKHAPHKAAALKFLEFLVTPAAQKIYAAAELEYPVTEGAESAPLVAAIGAFPSDTLDIDAIAANQKAAIALIRKVGFEK